MRRSASIAVLALGFAMASASAEPTGRPITFDDVLNSGGRPVAAVFATPSGGVMTQYLPWRGQPGSLAVSGHTPIVGQVFASDAAHGLIAVASDPGSTRIELSIHAASQARGVLARGALNRADGSVVLMRWSTDGTRLAVVQASGPQGYDAWAPTATANGVRVVDVGAALESRRQERSVVTIFGEDLVPKFSQQFEKSIINLSWDGTRGVVLSMLIDDVQSQSVQPTTDIVEWTFENTSSQRILSLAGRNSSARAEMSPDRNWLAFAADLAAPGLGVFDTLNLVSTRTHAVHSLAPNVKASGEYVWSPSGDSLFFTARAGGFDRIDRVDLQGQRQTVVGGPRRHYGLSLDASGYRLLYRTEDLYGRQDVREFDLHSHTERILSVLSDPQQQFALGRAVQIDWHSDDNVQLSGFLIYPRNYDSRTPNRLFVDVHGSGPGSWLYLYAPLSIAISPGPLEWHAWAERGYVVFVPDYRSTGSYGREATRRYTEHTDFSGVAEDSSDIEAGLRSVMRQLNVPAERVCVLGHSAGGPRVVRLLTRMQNIGAAVLHEAYPDAPLETILATSTGDRAGLNFEVSLGPLLGVSLSDQSAAYATTQLLSGRLIRTPTLIMTGNPAAGGTIPLPGMDLLFGILRQQGVPTRFLRFMDDGHVPRTPASAALSFQEAETWCRAHTGN